MNPKKENRWTFQLFVSGSSLKSDRMVKILEQICGEYLEGMCDIKVIDVVADPESGMAENIIATPTLIRKSPKPVRRIIGDLLDKEKLLLTLDIG